ncbi:hypothetical protein [Demequina litorisediminis]|uniref:Uncharacterized protein n=1 Tax=Demequina litorisediminis TaxID=1849022 RepID=A0ABQ6IJK7_9MICO|nr:hypothetical protein [Demequina litorisediminis]GMA37924.1 hypothetical protein GCM10025876_41280 [Demequina litorisediminis]
MSDAANNPWISKRATAIITTPPVAVRARREVSLQAGVVPPEAIDRLEVRDVAPGRAVWWVGAHGGAGESTLAALGGQDAHHCWPRPTDGSIARVALVARTNYQGLTRLMAALRQYAAGELPFVHLEAAVLNADQPGRLPKEPARSEAARHRRRTRRVAHPLCARMAPRRRDGTQPAARACGFCWNT